MYLHVQVISSLIADGLQNAVKESLRLGQVGADVEAMDLRLAAGALRPHGNEQRTLVLAFRDGKDVSLRNAGYRKRTSLPENAEEEPVDRVGMGQRRQRGTRKYRGSPPA